MSSIVKKRKSRGRTNLPQLVRNRNNGQKLIVEYNKRGQPHGKVATRLFSFLGVLARTMVRISYEDWSKVPSETKEKIWECIKVCVYSPFPELILIYLISEFFFKHAMHIAVLFLGG